MTVIRRPRAPNYGTVSRNQRCQVGVPSEYGRGIMNRHSLNGTFVRQAILLAVGLALSIGTYAGERNLAIVEPSAVGMNAEGLGKLGAAMQGFVDRGELAGVVTVVARHGKIAHFETYGMQDVETGVPMAKDTIFRIYSLATPSAWVAVKAF
ncbi:MAG: beta-lactamase family protein [Gammaproteobacteria bacterium]|nr:beta-lactamase family protein [Gammaproteobacteria bacterium]